METDTFQPLQGMSDIAAPEIHAWQHLEAAAREVLQRYCFTEVRTPVLERVEVFERSLGRATDVVQKEMYRFEDRGGRRLALRPEGTAGVIRHLCGRVQEARDARVYYVGPMFRSERPQAGRRRQFHQLGVEAIAPPRPAADAEVIALQIDLLRAWGVQEFRLECNTRGAPGDHERVATELRTRLTAHQSALCPDCRRRLQANPLRVLDCKNERCREVVDTLPPVTEWLSPDARTYFEQVQALLERLEIPVVCNPRLVRGLDYYAHTVWEVSHTGLGSQDALSGGGRYQLTFGKQTLEGVGFAVGLERVWAALQAQGRQAAEWAPVPRVYLVAQGTAAFEENLLLMQSLRMRGVPCAMEVQGRSLKAQMRAANRSGSTYVVVRGDAEMEQGTFQLKRMKDGHQQELDLPSLMNILCRPLASAEEER